MTSTPIALDIPPGINTDDTTFSAKGQWANGDNVRFVNGRPQTCGGESASHFTLASAAAPGNFCTDLFAITRSGSASIVYGQKENVAGSTDGILSIADGQGTNPSSPTVRTPASLGTNADLGWCFQAWGEVLLAAGRGTTGAQGGRLYEQTGTSTATHVTQAPARNTCILVTNERQVLSFGCNEEISTTFNPMCIRGSDIEDYTDWTTTSTNNAFEHILDGGGEIVTAKKVGQYIGAWTTTGLWTGQFTGDPLQAYRFDKVADGMCPLSVRSVVVHLGVAYWIDKTLQMRAWAPGAQVQTIPCPLTKDLSLSIATSPFTSLSHLAVNPLFGEIWYFYSNLANGGFIALSITETERAQRPIWFKGTQVRSAILFNDLMLIPGLAVKTAGTVHTVEEDETCMASAYIQTTDQYFDEGKRRVMILGAKPDLELLSASAVALNMIVTSRDYPQSTTTASTTKAITNTTTKADFRLSGKLFSVKFQSTDTDGWRLGKPVFDVVPMGER